MAVRAKVVASTAGAGGGFGAALVFNWLVVNVAGLDVPQPILDVFDGWVTALGAFLAGYIKRETVVLEESEEATA